MKKIGTQTYKLSTPVTILETASIVGPKESNGPLAKYFDRCLDDEFYGEKTWEKAESKIIREAVNSVITKSKIPASKIDIAFAGDLLNQCISSSFGLRDLNTPFIRNFWSMFNFCWILNTRLSIYRWRFHRIYNMCNIKSLLQCRKTIQISSRTRKSKTSNIPLDSNRLRSSNTIKNRKTDHTSHT